MEEVWQTLLIGINNLLCKDLIVNMAENANHEINRQNSVKHQWRKDKACAVCHSPFGVVGLLYLKKYFCKFCFRGICPSCSALNVEHQDPRKIETICKICFQISNENCEKVTVKKAHSNSELQLLQKKFNEIQEKVQKKQRKLEICVEKLKIEEKIFEDSETEILIERLRQEKHGLKEICEELKKELNEICVEIDEKEAIYFESETVLMDEVSSLEVDKKKCANFCKILAEAQDRHIFLQGEFECFRLPKDFKSKSANQMAREDTLRTAYEKLIEEEQFYCVENIKLLEEVTNAESEISVVDDKLLKIQGDIGLSPTKIDVEKDAIRELNSNLEDQQKLIRKLKHELESSKLSQDPISEKTCNSCLIV